MKLNSDPLMQAPDAVFRVWRHREKIEIEAAHLFNKMSVGLSSLWGENDAIAILANKAATDELRHAERCRKILSFSKTPHTPFVLKEDVVLGPKTLSLEDQVLYSCVAVGCVTETLSTALLVEMHKRAADGLIRETVHEILTDEIGHSRIGWAELARAAEKRDISWLQNHIPAMIHAALTTDVKPMLNSNEGKRDLSEFGILPPIQAQALMKETIHEVVLPGLKKFGLKV